MGGTLRLWDNGRRNITWDQAKFIDMGSLGRNSAFHVTAGELERAPTVCLAVCWNMDPKTGAHSK